MLAASWNDHWTPLNSISLISTFRCLYASINTPGLSLIQTCPVPSSQDSVLQLHHHLFAAHSFCIPNQFFFFFFMGIKLSRASPSVTSSIRICQKIVISVLQKLPGLLTPYCVALLNSIDGTEFPTKTKAFSQFFKSDLTYLFLIWRSAARLHYNVAPFDFQCNPNL